MNYISCLHNELAKLRQYYFLRIAVIAILLVFFTKPLIAGSNDEISQNVKKAILAEDWSKVADLLSDVTTETPSPISRLIKGHACLALNRNNQSFQIFSSSILDEQLEEWKDWTSELLKQNRNIAIAYYLSGDAYARLQAFDAALKTINKGLEISKDHYLILNVRGCLYATTNQLDNALKDFYNVTKIKPNFADGHCNFGTIWIRRKVAPQTAFESFNKALEISPDYIVSLNGRACANFALGHFEETISDLGYVSKISDWYNTPLANLALFTQIKNELTSNLVRKERKINPGTSIEAINSYASALDNKEARLELAYSKGHLRYNQIFKNLLNTLDANLSPENLKYYNNVLSLKNDIESLVNEFNRANPDIQPTIQNNIDIKLNQMEQNFKQLFPKQFDKKQIDNMSLSLMNVSKGVKIGIVIGGIVIGVLVGDPADKIDPPPIKPPVGTGEAIGVGTKPPVQVGKPGEKGDEQGEGGSGEGGKPDKDKKNKEKEKEKDKNATENKMALNKNFMLIVGLNGCTVTWIPPCKEGWPLPPTAPTILTSIDLQNLNDNLEKEENFWNIYQQSILESHETIKPEGIESVDLINAFSDKGIWLFSDLSLNYSIQQ